MCIFLPPFNNYYIHVKNGVFVVLVLRMYSILGEIVWFKEGKKWSCMHHVLLMDDFFFNYLTNGAHFMKDGIFLLPFCPLHQTGLVHYLTISVLHNLLFFLYNLCLVLWGLKTSLIYFSKWVFFSLQTLQLWVATGWLDENIQIQSPIFVKEVSFLCDKEKTALKLQQKSHLYRGITI